MNSTRTIFKKKDDNDTFIIVLFYIVWTKFFNFVGITTIYYETIMSFCLLGLTLWLASDMCKRQQDPISKSAQSVCWLFLLSIFWCYIYSGQRLYDSFRVYFSPHFGVLPLIVYFFFKKKYVSLYAIVRSIIIITVIYSLCYILGMATFPNSVFGSFTGEAIEYAEDTYEQRNVLRLNMQGADFVVLTIMFILTYFEHKKKYYFFLIPLFVMLIFRGTRTPFFVTSIICVAYFLFKIKYKIVAIVLAAIVAASLPAAQDAVLSSNSDNPVIRYIQLTSTQMDKQDDETDIRVEMTEYMFTEFNKDRVLPTLFGNGIPNGGAYGAKMQRLMQDNGYYVVDVGFTEIFIYFGIVGLVLYTLLLLVIIRVKVPKKCFFAKLYMIYLYLILPTNCALISLSPIMVAMALYVLYIGSCQPRLTVK